MVVHAAAGDHAVSLSEVPATSGQRRIVFAVAAILLAAFALTVPFADLQLPPFVSFNPSVESVVFVNDLVTAVLLFSQYATTRSRAILALATGYLYTALIVIPHILTYPGAFTGLLPAGAQSSAWLYYFWSAGLPVAAIVYVLLGNDDRANRAIARSSQSTIASGVALVICLVSGITLLAMAGDALLPSLVAAGHYSNTTVYILNPLAIFLTGVALVLLWSRRRSVLDYWLLLVMFSLTLNYVVAAVLARQRYSLGFYASRGFTLVASMIVLALLLKEMTSLYTRLARSNMMLERERSNKLMNVEATTIAIAHEIKQPITAIVANANAARALLAKEHPDLAEAQDALNDIAADGLRTTKALDGMRALFRTVNQPQESIDINEIALEVLHALRSELNSQNVVAEPELTSDMPRIHGNRAQLQQVLFNLVHNAVEAMGTTTDRSRVLRLMTHRRDRDAIAVAVKDSGPGIDPTRLGAIFDAFMTTKSQGTGLGLAICRVIVDRHGGQISAWSDGENGALFQFVLPIGSPEESTTNA
jgi:signal transduction histidine kinase